MGVLDVVDGVLVRLLSSRARCRSRSTTSRARDAKYQRAASTPTSASSSSSVMNSPARFDIDTSTPSRTKRTHEYRSTWTASTVVAHRLGGVAHPGDRPVVVGAPDVDQVVEAAAELLGDVADVGGEVRRLAVRADRRPGPCRRRTRSSGTRSPRPPRRGGRRSRSRSTARSTQPSSCSEASVVQTSKWTPSRSRLASMPSRTAAAAQRPTIAAASAPSRRRRRPHVVRDRGREVVRRSRRGSRRRAPARRAGWRTTDAPRLVDLAARVVEVVLARHALAARLEDAAEQVADERAAGVADRERAGRVGRHELDVDRARRDRRDAAPCIRLGEDRRPRSPRTRPV